VRGILARKGFGALLATLGFLMEQAGRRSRRFRSQITRDVVVEITSADGVARHYVFAADRRAMSSRPGPATGPTVALCFESAGLGFLTLLSPRAVGRIVQALLARRATVQGNAVLLLWFYGLTRMVIPLGRQRPLREPLPGALRTPDPSSRVAGRITREPAAAALDRQWTAAARQRARMAMLQGVAGELEEKAVLGL
jgi:hypothetical protein